MGVAKAKLIITLKANDTIVAEVEDAILWQKVLAAIHQPQVPINVGSERPEKISESSETDIADNTPIEKLAKRLGVSRDILVGAVDPSLEPPYLILDFNCWERMKKQLPVRGPGSISPTALVGTMLCLWFREASLGNPTQSQVAGILKEINVLDKNPSRGIKGSSWLQSRGNGIIVLNPAEISKAVGIMKSFCTKKWSKEDTE